MKPMGAEREMPLVLAAGRAQKNSNRNRILARMAGLNRAAPKILATECFHFCLLGAVRQEGNWPMQRRRCNAERKKSVTGPAGAGVGRVTGLAEWASVIYTFPLFIEISGSRSSQSNA